MEKQEKKMQMYRLTISGANILPSKTLRMNVSLFHTCSHEAGGSKELWDTFP